MSRGTVSWVRVARRLLSCRGSRPQGDRDMPRQSPRRALTIATTLVRVFYASLFFILLTQERSWDSWLRLTDMRLLWPVAWFNLTGTRAGVIAVVAGSMATTLLAAAWPGVRALRVLVFVGVLVYGAFWNSFGIIMHGWHPWIWIAGVFVLLPDGSLDEIARSVSRAQRYRQVFWAAQVALLLFYSLSGAFKVAAGFLQMWQGDAHAFGPEALARHTAYRLLEGAEMRPFTIGPFIADHPWVGWLPYAAALYLEFASVLVAFRPATQRVWALGLIGFHLGIFLTLTILFSWQVLLVALMLLCSPFAPPRVRAGQIMSQLPLIGDLRSIRLRVTAGVAQESPG